MDKRGAGRSDIPVIILRVYSAAVCLAAFLPALNPARLSGLISKNASLFTNAVSYPSIGSNFVRALSLGWIGQSAVTLTYIGALVCGIAVVICGAAFCFSFGEVKMRRLCAVFAAGAGVIGLIGVTVLRLCYGFFENAARTDRIEPMLPAGITAFYAMFALSLVLGAVTWLVLPKAMENDRYEIAPKYRLFLMILPFLALVTLFAYLPLWGWRYSFFEYKLGIDLSWDSFVGLKWFNYLFSNPATRADILRVLKNTFAMSGLGIITSWLPMMFAIFLSEIRSNKAKRTVQTLTTVPNFISWVLVYSVAFAIFSTEGFLNWMLINLGLITEGTNWLMSGDNMWIKMWAWNTWKGLGWGAIIYIAGISSIDPQLYEAATVDGANRYQKMWHVTVPGLLSTYFVMLLLSIANILSNGMDQYLVFDNPVTRDSVQVLDLYVYHLGLSRQSSGNNIPLATLIGMLKSIISVTLLFAANRASKLLREESIV